MADKIKVSPKGALRLDAPLEKLNVNHVDLSAKACYRKAVRFFL